MLGNQSVVRYVQTVRVHRGAVTWTPAAYSLLYEYDILGLSLGLFSTQFSYNYTLVSAVQWHSNERAFWRERRIEDMTIIKLPVHKQHQTSSAVLLSRSHYESLASDLIKSIPTVQDFRTSPIHKKLVFKLWKFPDKLLIFHPYRWNNELMYNSSSALGGDISKNIKKSNCLFVFVCICKIAKI